MNATHAYRRHGFTMLELLTVALCIAILAAMLFPVFAVARERARTITCHSNEGQLALALHMYALDHGGLFPPAGSALEESLTEYLDDPLALRCPSDWRSVEATKVEQSYHYFAGRSPVTDSALPLLSDRNYPHSDRAALCLVNGRQLRLTKSQWLARGWELPPPPPVEAPDSGSPACCEDSRQGDAAQ